MRFSSMVILLLYVASARGLAQQSNIASDTLALSIVKQAITALTGKAAVTDVTLNANVISVLGSDYETGTGTLQAKGAGESRIALDLSGGTRIDVRGTTANGLPIGAWKLNGSTPTAYAQHNCWTDAMWFFPGLSSLSQAANSRFVFKYIGAETHNGVPVQHIRVFQSGNDGGTLQRLSTMDFFLNSSSFLPVAIAFNSHPDDNMNADVPTEMEFAGYQSVDGVMVPFHFQEILNGGVILDVTVTNVVFNSGIPDNLFNLQ